MADVVETAQETQYAHVFIRDGKGKKTAMWNGTEHTLEGKQRKLVPLFLAEKFVKDNTPAPIPGNEPPESECAYELHDGDVILGTGGKHKGFEVKDPVTGEVYTSASQVIEALKQSAAKEQSAPSEATLADATTIGRNKPTAEG
jgi:hypothetical protein